mgnify:CR=1 FL=1
MKRNFIKTTAAVMSALILSLTCSNIVYAASGSAPDWIKKLDGVTVDPKAEEKAQQDAEKEAAYNQRKVQQGTVNIAHLARRFQIAYDGDKGELYAYKPERVH